MAWVVIDPTGHFRYVQAQVLASLHEFVAQKQTVTLMSQC